MTQDESKYVREQVLAAFQCVIELHEKREKPCSDLVKNIIESISRSYSTMIPIGNEHREDDERVRFLVDEMEYYLGQL